MDVLCLIDFGTFLLAIFVVVVAMKKMGIFRVGGCVFYGWLLRSFFGHYPFSNPQSNSVLGGVNRTSPTGL